MRLSLLSQEFPQPFLSLKYDGQLKKCWQQAVSHLKAGGQRVHLICDETTWAASWEQVPGLRLEEEGKDGIVVVGGAWSRVPAEDFSLMSPQRWKEASRSKQHLARVALHIVCKRTDNDQYAYDLCVLPRPAGICSARAMLETISEVLQMVTEAGDVPPAGISYDGGTPNSALNSMLLGLCSREAMQEWPFFRCCHTKETSFAYWPFRMLLWKDYLMVSFNGAFHYLKRLALQCLSGCRVIYMGSVFVNVSGGLEAGLPEHVYHAADPQSDKAGAMLLSPPYIGKGWQSFGTMLMALLSGLLVSSTTGSLGYDLRDIALHAFVAYYLLVLHVAHNQQVFWSGVANVFPCRCDNPERLWPLPFHSDVDA